MAAPSKDVINTDLLCPDKDYSHDSDIEVSIVVPALNEEITIGEFVDWCWEGIYKSGVSAEIIIVDSSSDKTSEIALSKNARVLRTLKEDLVMHILMQFHIFEGSLLSWVIVTLHMTLGK